MSFAVEFRREGAIVAEADGLPDRAAAKRLAEAEIAKHYADIAIVIDINGSGMEVASFRQDTKVWDDE